MYATLPFTSSTKTPSNVPSNVPSAYCSKSELPHSPTALLPSPNKNLTKTSPENDIILSEDPGIDVGVTSPQNDTSPSQPPNDTINDIVSDIAPYPIYDPEAEDKITDICKVLTAPECCKTVEEEITPPDLPENGNNDEVEDEEVNQLYSHEKEDANSDTDASPDDTSPSQPPDETNTINDIVSDIAPYPIYDPNVQDKINDIYKVLTAPECSIKTSEEEEIAPPDLPEDTDGTEEEEENKETKMQSNDLERISRDLRAMEGYDAKHLDDDSPQVTSEGPTGIQMEQIPNVQESDNTQNLNDSRVSSSDSESEVKVADELPPVVFDERYMNMIPRVHIENLPNYNSTASNSSQSTARSDCSFYMRNMFGSGTSSPNIPYPPYPFMSPYHSYPPYHRLPEPISPRDGADGLVRPMPHLPYHLPPRPLFINPYYPYHQFGNMFGHRLPQISPTNGPNHSTKTRSSRTKKECQLPAVTLGVKRRRVVSNSQPKKKHACSKCGRLFEKGFQLVCHIENIHNQADSHCCDNCATFSLSKFKMWQEKKRPFVSEAEVILLDS